ncbi:MAG: hypothetical protein FWE23_11120 [Chitinivibrionia bacterium]|jgi:hypothetical protein|nr:hypothetical protein [Chitinivibrionia bacterium]
MAFFKVLRAGANGFCDDDFKYKNSDEKLVKVVKENGGNFVVSNMNLLLNAQRRINAENRNV